MGRKKDDTGRPIRAKKPKRKIDDSPSLITHRVVAKKLGIQAETIREWIAKGVFPVPHSSFERTLLYREDTIVTFLETGKWPEGTKFWRR